MGQIKTDGKVIISTKLDNSGLKSGLKGIPSALSGIKSALSGIGGMLATAFSVTAIINFGKEAIKLGSDLTEVQNVVDVTFGSMSNRVNKFAKDAMKSYGMSETVAKEYMGVFGSMAKSFGFSAEEVYQQAETLTALTGDLTSFKGWESSDTAFTKLKAVYTGETEGLKELGVVMTQTALDSFALANGFGKTTKEMTEQEKVALRLAFVTDRLSDASSDFDRTSDSWANQSRVLSLQLESLKAALGQGFINILTPLLKNLNEVIAKLVIAAEKFRDFTRLVFGDAGEGSIFGDAPDSSELISSNIESAADSAKELKKQLAGFDKLNVLGSTDSGSTASTITTNTEDSFSDGEMGESVLSMTIEEAEELKEKIIDILGYVGSIAAGIAAWKLTNFIGDLLISKGIIENFPLTLGIGIALTVASIVFEWDAIVDSIQNGLDTSNAGQMIAGALGTTIGGVLTGLGLSSLVPAITTAVGVGFSGGMAAVIAGIPLAFAGIYDAVMKGLDWLNALIIPAGTTLASVGVGAIVMAGMTAAGTAVAPGVGTLIAAAVGLVLGGLIDIGLLIYQNWDIIMSWLDEHVVQPMSKLFEPLITAAGVVFGWLDSVVFSPIRGAIDFVESRASQKLFDIVSNVKSSLSVVTDKITEIKNKIAEIFSALLWAFNEYVWNPIKEKVINFYNENISPIVEEIKLAIQKIKDFLYGIWSWFETNVLDKVYGYVQVIALFIMDIGTKAVNYMGETLKSVINGVFGWIENSLNFFIRMLNGAIGIINKIPGVEIKTVEEFSIPRLAQGAVIPANKEFLAVLGDQKNGRNLELPENLLRQVVREESGGNRSGTPFIIQLILNGKIIGEEAVEYVNGVIRKTGKSPIKQGG